MPENIDSKRFYTSEFFVDHSDHLNWANSQMDFINANYLWKPVVVHVSDAFSSFVHQETNGREAPPYYGVLNPCDDEGNLVLFPWIRTEDRYVMTSRAISRWSYIDDILGGMIGTLDPVNLVARCDHKLVIPRSELWMMSRDPHDQEKNP